MKTMSYIKAILSGLIWGLGQLFNRQYLKALFFFVVFGLFVGIELGTGKYFYKEKYENEFAYEQINGKNLGDSFFESMPDMYKGFLDLAELGLLKDESVKHRTMLPEEIKSENFEQFLVDEGIIEITVDGKFEYLDKKLTEELIIKFLAEEIASASGEKFTNLLSGNLINAEDLNFDNLIIFKETIYYDEITNKFYENIDSVNVLGNPIKIYSEKNLFFNLGSYAISEPDVIIPERQGQIPSNLVAITKDGIVKTYNGKHYLQITFAGETAHKFIEINVDNDLIYFDLDETLLIDVTKPNGELYLNNGELIERYKAGLLVSGEPLQYKEVTIMYTLRRIIRQKLNTSTTYGPDDIQKFKLKLYLEMNPDIKTAFLDNQVNFFTNRAGLFVKGYWSVVTLGRTEKVDMTAQNSLDDNIIGVELSKLNDIQRPVYRGGQITILGHVSTMILIEGLIAVILSFFFFIFMIWSIIDAYRVSEKKRQALKVETTKEYFKSVWDNGFEYIVLSPALFVLSFISIMPIVFGFLLAFTNIKGGASMNAKFDYVGLENFFALFSFQTGLGQTFGKAFWGVLLWTIIWAIFSTFTVFFGGFIQALILNSEKVVFRKLWRTILILPWAIPALLSQMVFSVIFGDTGFINQMLMDLGVYNVFRSIGILNVPYDQVTGFIKNFWLGYDHIQWFSNPFNTTFVRTTLIVVNIWLGFPYFMALMTGIMTAIDKTLYEAADIDGATGLQKTMKITIPLVLYSTAPILIMTFSGNFNNFGVIYFITQGGPGGGSSTGFAGNTDILISWMYKLTVTHSIYNMASVFSVLIFLVVGSVTAWNLSKTRAFQGD